MPTYSYKCDNCSHAFTIRQSIKDDPLSECSECGGKVRRLISGNTGLIFKGSGFYLTDYARKNSSTANGKNGSSTEKSKKNSETKKASDPKTSKTEKSNAKS